MTDSHVLLWHWGRSGAGAKFTFELARHLPRCGVRLALSGAIGSDLCVLTRSLHGLTTDNVSTFDGNKATLRGKLTAALSLSCIPLIAYRFHRMLRKHHVDVALCAFQSIWDVATLPILSHGPVRSILILHDAFFHPGDEYPFRHLVLRRQIQNTDALIVLSEHVRQQAIEAFDYPADRIWKMQHAAFAFGRNTVHPAIHPRGSRPLRLLFFGRIIAYKGLDRLLLAVKLLIERRLSVKLVIAGSGSLEPYARLLDAAPHVEVHNRWLGDEEIAEFMAMSDVIILPYVEASQSGVAATAYAAGRQIVAYPIGGLVEQVAHGIIGLLAHDMSIEALADAIMEFVTHPSLLDDCAARALAHAQDELSWRKSALTVAEVIDVVRAAPRRRMLRREK